MSDHKLCEHNHIINENINNYIDKYINMIIECEKNDDRMCEYDRVIAFMYEQTLCKKCTLDKLINMTETLDHNSIKYVVVMHEIGFIYELLNDVEQMKKYYLICMHKNYKKTFLYIGYYYQNIGDNKLMIKYYSGGARIGSWGCVIKLLSYYDYIYQFCNSKHENILKLCRKYMMIKYDQIYKHSDPFLDSNIIHDMNKYKMTIVDVFHLSSNETLKSKICGNVIEKYNLIQKKCYVCSQNKYCDPNYDKALSFICEKCFIDSIDE